MHNDRYKAYEEYGRRFKNTPEKSKLNPLKRWIANLAPVNESRTGGPVRKACLS